MSRTTTADNPYLASMSSSITSRVTRSGSRAKGTALLSGLVKKKQRRKKDATARVLDYDEGDEDITSTSAASLSQLRSTSHSYSSKQTNYYASSNRTHSNDVSRSSRTSINHLYGLDNSDTELSDSESNSTQTSTHRATSTSSITSVTSYFENSWLYTSICSLIHSRIFHTIGGYFYRWWWFIGAPFYRLTSKVTVFDVWLLSKTTHYRRRWGILLILLLFLLPFLLIGLLSACRDNALYIPAFFSSREQSFVVKQDGSTVISGVALEEKIRQIISNLNIYQNLREEFNQIIIQRTSQQPATAGLSKEEVEMIVKGILAEKLAGFQTVQESMTQKDRDNSDQMKQLQLELAALQQKTQVLEKEVGSASLKLSNQEESAVSNKQQWADLQNQMRGLKARIEQIQLVFAAQMKNCCQNATEIGMMIQEKVAAALALLMTTDMNQGPGGFGGGFTGSEDRGHGGTPGVGIISFGDWLRNHFVSKKDMDAQLAAVAVKVTGDIMNRTTEYHSTHQRHETRTQREADTNVFITNSQTTLTENQVQMIVQQALSVFMADKTGMVDYALESAGGCILSTRCSEEYRTGTAQFQIFGIPVYYGSNSPRTVIQPEVHPGNCWAFKGREGYIVIQLSRTIIPTSFSLEHIPRSLSPTGQIDSAPKDFSVLGLQSEHDTNGQGLGNFTYNDNGPPIQFFNIETRHVKPTPIVELMIKSNHGNKDYTCLYRFRVHGTIHHH